MSGLSNYERRRLAEIEGQLMAETELAEQARRFAEGRKLARLPRAGWYWIALVLGVLAPIGCALATLFIGPVPGAVTAGVTAVGFATVMLYGARRG